MSKPLSRDTIFALVILIATGLLLILPTGFPTRTIPGSDRRPARVLEVDNDGVHYTSAFVYHG